MQSTHETLPCESINSSLLLPHNPSAYAECLSCPDFVTSCRGMDLTSLSGAEEKRAYHKAIKKEFGFVLKDIYKLCKNVIGESTINEYFGSCTSDYKWTTVTTIHNALLFLVAQKKGVPMCENSCSSFSSEVRNQLAAADLKVAAAELKAAQHETDTEGLRQKLTDTKAKHISQISLLEASHAKDMEWMKNEVKLWRRLSFVLLVAGLFLLACLVFYIGWDAAHPTTGLIRY